MNIQSMTGFGRAETESDNFSLTIEVKSVNHRFKDLRFKMGSVFNSQEMGLKKQIEASFTRGSFDIYINYKRSVKKQTEIDLDETKVKNYIGKIKAIAADSGVALQIQPSEFLKSDFYVEDENKDAELIEMLSCKFPDALKNLKASREEEGRKLVEKLKEHQAQYTKFYSEVIELKGSYQDKVKERLLKKFESEAGELKIDEPRFLQEVIYYLEKLDIDEEINRISIHLQKLDQILSGKGEIGRQLEFLLQELNRETNTIGSKSGDSQISENIVQMKVQLEKIREQALNLQ